ncbi:hypothetical protein [Cystobacter ferrugineus]|uniref:Uncharacterized protein n=1 Tax=Cystobacter ferrugineus TaxID=83449 RepID=A0A1L9B6V2_9BACT|nr:hypothetical protein [Cystobacter ferrugineus]OJH37999.1 hypothetical protein BON30_22775 [Cystobacter ferrugineus]
MKVDDRHDTPPTRSVPEKDRFQELMKRAPPEPTKRPPPGGQGVRSPGVLARGALGARTPPGSLQVSPRGAFASAELLGRVRQGLSAEAHRLGEVRGEAHQTNQERVHQRLTALIARELAREPPAEPGTDRGASVARGGEVLPAEPPDARPTPPGTRLEGSPGPAMAGATSPGETRVQSTLALIEKIEVFVRSQRPALALRLGGALEATVEVERTGPREVALRIQGHRGPLPRENLARIQEELAARGLRLKALSSA